MRPIGNQQHLTLCHGVSHCEGPRDDPLGSAPKPCPFPDCELIIEALIIGKIGLGQ